MLMKKFSNSLIGIYATKSPKQFLPLSLNNINATQLAADVFKNSKLTSYNGLERIIDR